MSRLVQISDPAVRNAPALEWSPRTRKREPGPRPAWLKVRYKRDGAFEEVRRLKDRLDLVTVCEEARCPNIDECWSAGTATFMLMGEICTRRCGFCAVQKGSPEALDPTEPGRIGQAVARMNVKHAVITSVNRDELSDGGASHFADTVTAIREASPATHIELLVPDFLGDLAVLEKVLRAGPHIVAHNTETVPRLYKRVRPQALYQRSLDVLRHISSYEGVMSKTGLMLGLGESDAEVEDVMWDLRDVGCQILSLGQYLSPTTRHLAVERWVHPDTFARFAEVGRSMGFHHVESGPMVRSSYMAHRALDPNSEQE